MANTIISTGRTIEISAMDSDYTMNPELNVESVVLIPGASGDQVEIREFVEAVGTSPAKTLLVSGDGETRTQYFRQRLRLCFEYGDATTTLSAGSKVIFNIGER